MHFHIVPFHVLTALLLSTLSSASPLPAVESSTTVETLPVTTAIPSATATASASPSFPSLYVPRQTFQEVFDRSQASRLGSGSFSVEDVAKQYIAALTNSAESRLNIYSSVRSANNLTHIYIRHLHENVPIVNLVGNVNVMSDGSILSAGSAVVDSNRLTTIATFTSTTVIDAVLQAAKGFGYDPNEVISKLTVSDDGTRIGGAPFAVQDIRASQKLYYLPSGQLDRIWDLEVRTANAWYNFWVSRSSGEILGANNWVKDFGGPEPGPGLISYSVVPYTRESLLEGTEYFILPEDQWHTEKLRTGEFDTSGNNGRVFFGGDTVSSRRSGRFNYDYNSFANPSASYQAVATNVFYVMNKYHDILYNYGFAEIDGNFQDQNLNNAGNDGDAIIANIQANGNCNADFATPPDGQPGYMNMYICDRAIPARDTGMDNGVIIHELTHGLSNRLTGGPANANCLSTEESGGMGEGWSDTLAWWSSLKSHDSRATLKVIGLYSFDSLSGIRAYPYSTSLVINPLRYSDAAGRTWLEVHYTGTIWSSMLYEVYWNMRDMDGFEPFLSKSESTAGNIRFMQNLVDGLKLQPCNPTFVDARDAILQADLVNHNRRYFCAIGGDSRNAGWVLGQRLSVILIVFLATVELRVFFFQTFYHLFGFL